MTKNFRAVCLLSLCILITPHIYTTKQVTHAHKAQNDAFKKAIAKKIIKKKCAQNNHCIENPSCDNKPMCCKRGKKGKKGNTGETGPQGPPGTPGLPGPSTFIDELFINAPMMTNSFAATPNTAFNITYGPQTALEAWEMLLLGDGNPANIIGTQFIIPSTLDTTQPITLTLHCFNIAIPEIVGDVQFLVQTDYKSNNQQLGTSFPSTGFAEAVTTSSYTIIDPLNPNLRYFSLTVPLNPALLAGNRWGYISVNRVLTETPNYFGSIYLTEISIQYTKVNP